MECHLEEREEWWVIVIAVDFSGHVDGGNRADDEALGGGQSVFLTDCHEDYGFWMQK